MNKTEAKMMALILNEDYKPIILKVLKQKLGLSRTSILAEEKIIRHYLNGEDDYNVVIGCTSNEIYAKMTNNKLLKSIFMECSMDIHVYDCEDRYSFDTHISYKHPNNGCNGYYSLIFTIMKKSKRVHFSR